MNVEASYAIVTVTGDPVTTITALTDHAAETIATDMGYNVRAIEDADGVVDGVDAVIMVDVRSATPRAPRPAYINWCQSKRSGISCEVGYMGAQQPHVVDEHGDLIHRHANATWIDISHNREATPTDLGYDK